MLQQDEPARLRHRHRRAAQRPRVRHACRRGLGIGVAWSGEGADEVGTVAEPRPARRGRPLQVGQVDRPGRSGLFPPGRGRDAARRCHQGPRTSSAGRRRSASRELVDEMIDGRSGAGPAREGVARPRPQGLPSGPGRRLMPCRHRSSSPAAPAWSGTTSATSPPPAASKWWRRRTANSTCSTPSAVLAYLRKVKPVDRRPRRRPRRRHRGQHARAGRASSPRTGRWGATSCCGAREAGVDAPDQSRLVVHVPEGQRAAARARRTSCPARWSRPTRPMPSPRARCSGSPPTSAARPRPSSTRR